VAAVPVHQVNLSRLHRVEAVHVHGDVRTADLRHVSAGERADAAVLAELVMDGAFGRELVVAQVLGAREQTEAAQRELAAAQTNWRLLISYTANLSRLGQEPIAEAELAARKAYIIGNFGRSVETTAGLAGQYSALAQFGLPLEKLQTYSAEISGVTAERAGAAARKYFDPANATLVIVGDAAKFWDAVKDTSAGTGRAGMERIGIDELKLGSGELK